MNVRDVFIQKFLCVKHYVADITVQGRSGGFAVVHSNVVDKRVLDMKSHVAFITRESSGGLENNWINWDCVVLFLHMTGQFDLAI